VPYVYVVEMLARRWNVPPWVLESDEADPLWIIRGLEFIRMETSVKVRNG